MNVLATIVETQQRAFELAGLPSGWMRLLSLLAVVALLYVVFWLYRREARVGAGLGLRIFMAMLRCSVLLLLAGIWLQPTIATYLVRTVHGRVAVVVDSSASMSIADGGDSQEDESRTRASRVAALLEGDGYRWLRRLAERNELSLYTFAERTARMDLPWNTPDASVSAVSSEPTPPMSLFETLPAALRNRTDIGQAVSAAIDENAGNPLAGIVVVTDGGSNKGMAVDAIGALARRARAPLYVIGVGADTEPMNVRVASISAPPAAPLNDPFEVRVELVASGIEITPMRLELLAEPIAGAVGSSERLVESRNVLLGGERSTLVELFRVTPASPGEFLYRARIEPAPGEPLETDNQRDTTVLVTDEKLRVLLVAGRPSNDYRLVTALLTRDKTIELSCWLQSADERAVRDGNVILTELPRRPEEIFAYDMVILMDPSPGELDTSWAVLVRRMVDEFGGGLLFQAGTHFSSRFLRDPRMQDLVAILPVTPDPDADVRLSEEGPYRLAPVTIEIPAESTGHPLIALQGDPSVSRELWAAVSNVWWHLPVQREKPIASLLMRAVGERVRGGAAPLLAVQPFGAGRVAFMAFDSTWRWRSTAEPHFNRFWVQLVRYLSQARREGISRRGTIVIERDVVNIGESIQIEARVLDAGFLPISEPRIDATLDSADGTQSPIALSPVVGREGWYSGRVAALREGPATVRVPLLGGSAGEGALRKRVRVVRPELEMQTLRMQSDTLLRLADLSNGKFIPLRDAASLPDEIPSGDVVRPPVRIGDEALWDRGWLLALISGLLALEWTLRRRSQLL